MSDCIIPKQRPDTTGYVRIKRLGRRFKERMHHIEWEKVNGCIPKGMLLCHTCDNRACCNPEHLFLGTHQSNADDAVKKMRTTIGSRNPSAKLSEQQVVHIKLALISGVELKAIAAEYGVSLSCVYGIKTGKSWGWLDADPVTRRC